MCKILEFWQMKMPDREEIVDFPASFVLPTGPQVQLISLTEGSDLLKRLIDNNTYL